MHAFNRPVFNRNQDAYIKGVSEFVLKQLTTLNHYRIGKLAGSATGPSEKAIATHVNALHSAFTEFRFLADQKGKHLTKAHLELEQALDDIESLVARCQTTPGVTFRGDTPIK